MLGKFYRTAFARIRDRFQPKIPTEESPLTHIGKNAPVIYSELADFNESVTKYTDDRFIRAADMLVYKGISSAKQFFALGEFEVLSVMRGVDYKAYEAVEFFRIWHRRHKGVELGNRAGVDLSHMDWPVGEQNKPRMETITRTRENVGNMGEVLLIYVHDELRKVIQRWLITDGFTVRTASTMNDGIRLLTEAEPDIILLDDDIREAEVSSLIYCKMIRNMTKAHIILHSHDTDVDSEIAGISAGADEHVSKIMCSMNELIVRMDNVMIRRENYHTTAEMPH